MLDPLSSLTGSFANIYEYLGTIKTHLASADFEELFKAFALYEKYEGQGKAATKPVDIEAILTNILTAFNGDFAYIKKHLVTNTMKKFIEFFD